MARHSKWHKVRQFKGAIDAKRSASFTKLAREITVAVREKGTDPTMNVRLKVAVERARKASMPKDNIERAIQRGSGGGEGGELEQLMYEGYGPGGTAMIIGCVTDNRNRTANDVKHLLSKHGGSLAASGAVTYLFDYKGMIHIPGGLSSDRREELELALIDSGAEDIRDEEGEVVVQCSPHDLGRVANVIQKNALTIESADSEWLPKTTVDLSEEQGMALAELVDSLEELDDVAAVHTNAT